MLIILFFFTLISTLRGVPLSSPIEARDSFPAPNKVTADTFGQRSVNDIIISCFATIFACTWSAVHPNIPAVTDCMWTRLKRKIFTMLYALLAPEVITAWALSQRLAARDIAAAYNKDIVQNNSDLEQMRDGKTISLVLDAIRGIFQDSALPPILQEGKGTQWTLTHGFFLQMGGFMLCEGGRPIQTLNAGTDENTTIMWNILNGFIDPPRISEEDIKDRSKGNAISKTFIILQTTWFIVQCIARWAQHLPVTELEVVTLGFAMLNGITYGIWWNKPQNVGRPVFLEIKKPRTPSNEIPFQPGAISLHPISGKKSWLRSKMRQDIERHSRSTPWKLIWHLPLRSFEAFVRPLFKMTVHHAPDDAPSDLRVGMFYSAESLYTDNFYASIIIISASGTLFGSVHLIPSWFLAYSSLQEMWLWRVSAIIITAEPIFLGILVSVDQEFLTLVFGIATLIVLPFYTISRVVLLTLSLISLRSLPSAALQTVEWTTFLPHL